MFKNYFKVAFRNLSRSKGYTLITLSGLAIGIAACLLAFLYIQDELSYDRFHEKSERIFRITTRMVRDGVEINIVGAGAPAAKTMVEEFPEVENAVRFREEGSAKVQVGATVFREKRVIYSDPSFFDVFSVPLLKGDRQAVLAAPRTVVLSKTTAEKYFGAADPVGRTLRIDDKDDWQVSGVFADIPRTSHFHFDLIASFSTLDLTTDPSMGSWMSFNFQTYLLLRPGASASGLEAKLPLLFATHLAPEIKQFMGISLEDFMTKAKMKLNYSLQPLAAIHLHSNYDGGEFEPNSDIKYIFLFSAVSLFILILAIINFVNLSTARSISRAKEVGLRKVLGSFRLDLIKQFLTESLVLCLLALAVACLLLVIILPLFNSLTAKELAVSALANPAAIAAVLALTLLVTIMAGAYPAFLLSAFRPASILRGQAGSGAGKGRLRRGLVVFQFAVSAVMIIGTIVVFRQLHYIQNKKLGFDKEQVLILRHSQLLGNHAETLKQELAKVPQVVSATLSSYLPIPSARARMPIARADNPNPRQAFPISFWQIDEDYIATLGMKIVAGRNFSAQFSGDAQTVLINQAAVRHFGLKKPLGQTLIMMDMDAEKPGAMVQVPCTVIGVVEDFHYESLREAIAPLVLRRGQSLGNLVMRLKPGQIAAVIKTLKRKWTALLPGEPFEYAFLDESLNMLYESEMRIGSIFAIFAALAVFIGCLGLFGLASFSAAKRTKEIGIRKVLGAAIHEMALLLVRDYVLLVGLANLIAWPVAYYLMQRWLQNFAYRTSINVTVFVLSGLLGLAIALLTVGYQAIRAARANPVDSLRYE
ncbi:MAG TPA: ABC transporter permease [Patescibacteria group bacterium]|nr:ABC transporter permease [Patescibacteria group bacterium]